MVMRTQQQPATRTGIPDIAAISGIPGQKSPHGAAQAAQDHVGVQDKPHIVGDIILSRSVKGGFC